MTTEFTCGIYTAIYTPHTWSISVNNHKIGAIGEDGLYFQSSLPIMMTISDFLEIGVLMEMIKRQYKNATT